MDVVVVTYFVISFLIYCGASCLYYHEPMRESVYFIPLGVLAGLLANLLWMLLIRHLQDKQKVYEVGVYWDVMMTAIHYIIPILLFGVKLNYIVTIGIVLLTLGTYLVRLGFSG